MWVPNWILQPIYLVIGCSASNSQRETNGVYSNNMDFSSCHSFIFGYFWQSNRRSSMLTGWIFAKVLANRKSGDIIYRGQTQEVWNNGYLVLLHFHNLCLHYKEMNDQYYEHIERTESAMQECVPILKSVQHLFPTRNVVRMSSLFICWKTVTVFLLW